MYTKVTYYAKPPSLRMTDDEIDALLKQVRAAEESAVETMRDERALDAYEAAWRDMYEADLGR